MCKAGEGGANLIWKVRVKRVGDLIWEVKEKGGGGGGGM